MTWQAQGPYMDEQDALAHADWRHVDVSPYDNEAWRQGSRRVHEQRLRGAVQRTGTPTSAWEQGRLDWLAGLDTSTVELVASLLERAYKSGARDAGGCAMNRHLHLIRPVCDCCRQRPATEDVTVDDLPFRVCADCSTLAQGVAS